MSTDLERYRIRGAKPLKGTLRVSGAKNAALPILAASLLTGECCRIENCPDIADVRQMKYIIASLGGQITDESGGLAVRTESLRDSSVSQKLSESMRSSLFTAGPLLARLGQAEFYEPGGCRIGARPIDLHLSVFAALGAEIKKEGRKVLCRAGKNGLSGAEIWLPYPSVGATENAMCAAVLARGTTMISGAAQEPEIEDLARFLQQCGAQIDGAGSPRIQIRGVRTLHGAQHRIIPDRIECGTFLIAAAATGGEIFLERGSGRHLERLLTLLSDCGCRIEQDRIGIALRAPERLWAARSVRTAPYPEFPTDLQPQLLAALCAARGTSEIEETVFENRFGIAKELRKMGAMIEICGKHAIINGTESLRGAELQAGDLRGGAGLVIAALAAEGQSLISGIEHINRGYCRFSGRLAELGAEIERIL